jgi:hypothetical protein
MLLSTNEQKTAFFVIYTSKSTQDRLFFYMFLYILGGMGAYFTPLTSSTTIPCPGSPPTNSRRTMQFLRRPHSL